MAYQIGQIIAITTSASPALKWAVCDGSTVNGIVTPDLREFFIMGANGDEGVTGGALSHTHSYGSVTGNSTAHNHTLSSGNTYGVNWYAGITMGSEASASSETHTHTFSAPTVNNNTTLHAHALSDTQAGTNIPAHIKLLFIIKVE